MTFETTQPEQSSRSVHHGLRYAFVAIVTVGLLATVLTTLASGRFDEWLGLTPPAVPDNFHPIVEGKAYRSNQPTREELDHVIKEHGIRTVINLRGENPDELWYMEEVDACDKLNVTHVDHRFSAQELPEPDTLKSLLETLRGAEEPILIHCRAGADRTGLASAIYRMAILGDKREDAMSELSHEYMHARVDTPCMDTLAEIFEPTDEWLNNYAHDYPSMECK